MSFTLPTCATSVPLFPFFGAGSIRTTFAFVLCVLSSVSRIVQPVCAPSSPCSMDFVWVVYLPHFSFRVGTILPLFMSIPSKTVSNSRCRCNQERLAGAGHLLVRFRPRRRPAGVHQHAAASERGAPKVGACVALQQATYSKQYLFQYMLGSTFFRRAQRCNILEAVPMVRDRVSRIFVLFVCVASVVGRPYGLFKLPFSVYT